MWRNLFFCAAVFLLAGNTWAGANDVIADKVWMRESVPGQISATVQLNLYATKEAKLLSVSSPVSESGEIQTVVLRRGKSQPQTVAINSLRLAAHSTTLFGTHGMYLSLVGLKQQLNVGDRVPIALVVEVAGKRHTIKVEAEVKALELSYQHYNNPTVKDQR